MFMARTTRWCIVILIVIAMAPTLALAAGLPTQIIPERCTGPDAAKNCSVCDIAKLVQNVLNAGIFLAVFLSAALFAWAGWNYLTASGNSSQATKAREVFTNVAVGFLIILAAWLVIDTLMATMTGSHLWSKIC